MRVCMSSPSGPVLCSAYDEVDRVLVDVTSANGRPGEVGRAEIDLMCSAEPYIGAIILGRLDIPYHEKIDGR